MKRSFKFGNTLYTAVVNNNLAQVKELLKAGENPNVYTGYLTPLLAAASEGYTKIALELIKAGAQDLPSHDGNFTTPLFLATYKGNNNIVGLIILLSKPFYN